MRLYAIPFSCSLASHIVLREARLDHEIEWVTRTSVQLEHGGDLRGINPKGKVATVVSDDGTMITENIAVLLWLAQRAPERHLAPPEGTLARLRMVEWLSFVATELHKQILWVHFDPFVPQVMKDHVVHALLPGLLRYLADTLSTREFLVGEHLSVADAYLFWALLLVPQLGVSLDEHTSLVAYRQRILAREPVREALAIERRALTASQASTTT